MKLCRYGKMKRGIAFYQRRVPDDVRKLKPFSTMSAVYEACLHTSDVTKALELVAKQNAWFERHLAAARAGLELPEQTPPPTRSAPPPAPAFGLEQARYFARREFDLIVEFTIALRKARFDDERSNELWEEWQDFEVADLNSVIDRLRDGDPNVFNRKALRILEANGYIDYSQRPSGVAGLRWHHPFEKTAEFRMLCDALTDYGLEAYEALQLLKRGGHEAYEPKSKTLRDAPLTLHEAEKYAISTVAELTVEASPTATKVWTDRISAIADIWTQFGLPSDIRKVERAHVHDLVAKLLRSPVNKTQRYPTLSWPEAILANKEAGGKRLLSANSVQRAYLAPLQAIFAHAERTSLIKGNPSSKIKVKGSSKKGKRIHFELHELSAMLQLPQFTGCFDHANVLKPGDIQLDDHWFWGPLIALFTGARTAEIAQLRVTEVIFNASTPHFIFQEELADGDDDDEERGLKTENAIRLVPIHSVLLKIGLREYVERIKATGSSRLFPDWDKPGDGDDEKGYSQSSSQRHFNRNVVKRISSRTVPRPTFHSFRHTMKTQMFRYGVPQQHQDAIVGHELSGMSSVYTTGFDIDTLGKSMESVAFEGLEISHLYGARVN